MTCVERSVGNRLFIEFIGLTFDKVNAYVVRQKLNKLFGPLLANVPCPPSAYVRVSRIRVQMLESTEISGYKISHRT